MADGDDSRACIQWSHFFMSRVKLKVCGITRLEDALAAVECGADYLGFNFYPPSPRYIAPVAASEIVVALPGHVICVGVFVNEESPDGVRLIMQQSRVKMAQLHGDENEAFCESVGRDCVIKTIRLQPGVDITPALSYPAAAVLIDAYHERLYGGTGRRADWSIAHKAAQSATLFLAGGLHPGNIREAISAVNPFAVDVNSGVESEPGKKDPNLLLQLKQAMET